MKKKKSLYNITDDTIQTIKDVGVSYLNVSYIFAEKWDGTSLHQWGWEGWPLLQNQSGVSFLPSRCSQL